MALVSIDNINCDTQIGVWKKEEQLELLENVFELNASEKSEYNNITNESRKKEWLLVRILLTEMLMRKDFILYNTNKKPYLQNSKLNISISHSRNFIAIITSKNEFAGIDVEQISERVHKVKHKFLNNSELEWCHNLEQQTTCWCAKESVFKLYEANLDFHDMVIAPFELEDNFGKIKLSVIKPGKQGSYVINYQRIENDIISYTLSKSNIAEQFPSI